MLEVTTLPTYVVTHLHKLSQHFQGSHLPATLGSLGSLGMQLFSKGDEGSYRPDSQTNLFMIRHALYLYLLFLIL